MVKLRSINRSIHRANNPDDKCEVDRAVTQTVRIVGNDRSKGWLKLVKSTAVIIQSCSYVCSGVSSIHQHEAKSSNNRPHFNHKGF